MSGIKFGKVANNPATTTADIAPAIEMGISNAPSRLIVKYITDMYSYPLEAAIRETVSNAIDAAIRAGRDISCVRAYIDHAAERFCVIDKGEGMSDDTLVNVYTQYGVSDKRDDDEATGAFGLGAKSPLAYTREFHITTKTTDEGCRYVHCYRTVSDDFLADPPVKVDGQAEIIDNLAAANGGSSTIKVSDPFAADETGTLVSFPLNWRDLDKADAILKSVDYLLYNTEGVSIVDEVEYNRDPRYFNLGTFEIADDKDEGIEATIYLADGTAHNNSSESIARRFANIAESVLNVDKNGLDMDNVAFKVTNWLYPADGSAWHYTEFIDHCDSASTPYIIVEVPSRALPFIPSRDTIRADRGNVNAVELVRFAGDKLKEALYNKKSFAAILNWLGDVGDAPHYKTIIPTVMPCTVGVFDSDKMKAGTLSACSQAGEFTLEADLADLHGIVGYSIAELADMPPVVFGFVSADSAGIAKLKNGPVIVADNRAVQVLGGKHRVSLAGGATYKLLGYGAAKSKKVADTLIADGPNVVATKGGYAAKDFIAAGQADYPATTTYAYPSGLGLVNAHAVKFGYNKGKTGRLLIIDGSEYGISKIRAGISRIFYNNAMFDTFGDGMIAIIPPKSEHPADKWDKAELSDLVDKLVTIGETLFEKVVYVPADKVAASLTKAENDGLSAAERSELDKMFNLNRTVIHSDHSPYQAFAGSTYSSQPNLGKEIAANPGEWGVIIADSSKQKQAYDMAVNFAKVAFALDLMPTNVTKIACIGSDHYNLKRAELLDHEGITVIYDESNTTPFDTVVDAGTFYWDDAERCVAYGGEVPNFAKDFFLAQTANNGDTELMRLWKTIFGSSYSYQDSCTADIEYMVNQFTFGHESYKQVHHESVELEGWVKSLLNSTKFTNLDLEASDGFEQLKERISDVLVIWKNGLKRASLALDWRTMDNLTVRTSAEVARTLGVADDVESYYNQIPIADILA